MAIRGVRGATTVEEDEPGAILLGTRELLEEMLKENSAMRLEDLASALFTLTDDLTTAYPALAARQIGWEGVPMICSREIPVPESLPRVIRVLIHWNTDVPQSEIRHVYLRDAIALRPDLSQVRQPALSGVEEKLP